MEKGHFGNLFFQYPEEAFKKFYLIINNYKYFLYFYTNFETSQLININNSIIVFPFHIYFHSDIST